MSGFDGVSLGAKYEEAVTSVDHCLPPASALKDWTSSVSLRSVVSLLRRRTSTAYSMAAVRVVPSAGHVQEGFWGFLRINGQLAAAMRITQNFAHQK